MDQNIFTDLSAYYARNPDERLEKMLASATAGRPVEECPAVFTAAERETYRLLLAECQAILEQGGQVETRTTLLD